MLTKLRITSTAALRGHSRRTAPPLARQAQQRYHSSSSSFRERWHLWRQNGTLEIAIGSTLLGLILVDQVLQYRQDQQRNQLMHLLQMDANSYNRADNEEQQKQRHAEQLPTLFRCTIRRLPNLDGSKTLNTVQIGDVVEVLEEKVGPGEMYNLCRNTSNEEVGWFPTICLEKMNA